MNVISLMDALKQSIAADRGGKPGEKRGPSSSSAKKAGAKKKPAARKAAKTRKAG